MRFALAHRTTYRYAGDAVDSFMEVRLAPMNDDRQHVLERTLETRPACNVRRHVDYFGNTVESFSVLQRHRELFIFSRALVETNPPVLPATNLAVTVAEARQLFHSGPVAIAEFGLPSPAIPLTESARRLASDLFRSTAPLGEALEALLDWIKAALRYVPGSTRIDTSVDQVLWQATGVCQDFAQVAIAVLRSADLPARYVTGYIETESERRAAKRGAAPLVGASESHAWFEVYLPGGVWWPLDPTNHGVAGERHVKVAHGRDYNDTAPTRGVFKGAATESLSVAVTMQRIEDPPAAANEPI